ncbi:MAG: periplasmic heavy metal sensor [Bacteroidota bacterium]
MNNVLTWLNPLRALWIILILIGLNVLMLATFWGSQWTGSKLPKPPHRVPIMRFLHEKLTLDEAQMTQLRALQLAHRQEHEQMSRHIHESRIQLFELLKAQEPDSIEMAQKSRLIGDLSAQRELSTYHFLQEIRKICRPAQTEKFEEVFHDMLKDIGPPGPGRLGPGPGRRPSEGSLPPHPPHPN